MGWLVGRREGGGVMDEIQAKQLREKFPPASIGKLPKGGVMLDYVGHAATTDRLLEVDREWTWEPLALDQVGLPAIDAAGNLWIKLTVCGVTRLGVGDGKNMKERIGDAIRNAAMRFGVALDLWSKEELSSDHQPPPPDDLAIAKQRVWDLTENRGDMPDRVNIVDSALKDRGKTRETATAEDYNAIADTWQQEAS